jgi:AcrR family transcriptional regulator
VSASWLQPGSCSRHGVSGVATQQIADRAGVAIGTLYLYASTKAELLLMGQNAKFAAAIDHALRTRARSEGRVRRKGLSLSSVLSWRACESRSRTDERTCTSSPSATQSSPTDVKGLALSACLEDGLADLVSRGESVDAAVASTLARVITAIIHLSTTATVYLERSDDAVLADIRDQIRATLASPQRAV